VIAFLIPGLRELLGIVPLSVAEWGLVIGVALSLLMIVEVGKAIANRLHAND
jgi:Ca2+-transporting ATPase